jgi:O-antigen/teichoic acid export membrane protein
MLKRLLLHASNYSLASVLVTLAGLISFPIFTRVFSVSEYGLLSLVSATLGLMVGVGKLGLQTSIIRFHAEASSGRTGLTEDGFFSTALLGMLATGTIATVGLVLFAEFSPAAWWSDPQVRSLMTLTAVLVLIRVLDSGFINILRAQQRSGVYGIYSVARRYGGLAIVLFIVLHVMPSLNGFYIGTIVSEALAVLAIGWLVLRRHQIRFSLYSPALLRSMLAFGLPMVAYEMGGLLLAQGDRYVIEGVLGGDALGVYSAAYNFSEYVQMALLTSFGTAVTPMYTRIWEKEGEAATRRFIELALHFYILAGGAVAFGMAALGADALSLLASHKYVAGAAIIPWVIGGMVMDGAHQMLGAGLYLHKRSKTVMLLVVGAAVVNIGINLLLVPAHGIMGAAIATLITYVGLTVAIALCGRRHLKLDIPWLHTFKAIAFGAVMYAVTVRVGHDHLLLTIVLKLLVAGAVYGALVVAFDRRTRSALTATWARLRPAAPKASA